MSEVTKQDIAELYNRIDYLNATMTTVQVTMMKIETTLKMQPGLPARPCTSLTEHIAEHQEIKDTWQKPIIRTVIDLAKMAVVATVTYLCVRRD